MHKIIVITQFLALLLTTNLVQAQTVYGVSTGFGLTGTNDGSALAGFQLGVIREKAFCQELIYGRLGATYYAQRWKNSDTETTTSLNYIQISPMLKADLPYFPFWDDMYLQAGIYLGSAIGGKNGDQKMKFGRKNDKMKFFDYGITTEIGKQFFDNLQVGLGVKFGIRNLSNVNNNSTTNVSMMLNTTYMFGNKAKIGNETDLASGNHWFCRTIENNGRLLLHISLPHFDYFQMTHENETKKTATGIGVGIGFDYYHSDKQFVHLGWSNVTGSRRSSEGSWFSATGRISNTEYMDSYSINLTNNHKISWFSIGYGLSYAMNVWEYKRVRSGIMNFIWFILPYSQTEEYVKKTYNALGLIFPAYFQTGNFFNIGIVYRPTFYRPNLTTDKFLFENLVSIDCVWKIRLTL